MRLDPRQIEEEIRKSGIEDENDAQFEELSPHDQAIENIISDIDLEYGNYFTDAICGIHEIPTTNRGCTQCNATARDMEVRVREIGSKYRLDAALFNFGNIEYLTNLDDWLTRVQKCWFDNGLAKMYYPETFAEMQKFKDSLTEKGLIWKIDADHKCENTPYELHQIVDAFLEFRNEHEMDILRGEKVEVANVMY